MRRERREHRSGSSATPAVEGEAPAVVQGSPGGLQGLALGLQSGAGNARAVRALGLLRQPDPPKDTPPPPVAQATTLVNRPVDFTTPKATLGGVGVSASGRLVVGGAATVTDGTLPARASQAVLATRAGELIAAGLSAATPTGTATRIEVPVGGRPMVLELAAAPTGPAFQVTARFTARGGTLSLPGVEVTSPQIMLDAIVWLTPPAPQPAPAGAGQPTPGATGGPSGATGGSTTPPASTGTTPTGTAPTGTRPTAPAAAPNGPGDAEVTSFSFAGDVARFSDTARGGRSGSVSLKSSYDDFTAKLPADAKAGALGFLSRPEQILAFFQEMRAYFGTDDKTIAHFAKFRKANIKGATTILHEEAAARLEAVQAEITVAEMPASGGIGWPRSECKLSGQAGLGNLHNLGMAVDFNATQAPHIKDARIRDLITVTTGRGPTANYPSTRGIDTRKVGETATTGTDAEKDANDKDARITAWLDGVEAEATALGQASEDFRGSLKTTADPKDPKSAVVDNGPKLVDLRRRWHAAAKKPAADRDAERAAVMAELPAVVKPWSDKVAAFRATAAAQLTGTGIDEASLPAGLEAIATAALAAERMRDAAKPLIAAPPPAGAPAMPKARRGQVDGWIRQARVAVGEPAGAAPADDAAAITELTRLDALLATRGVALLARSRIIRMDSLSAALADSRFMFGDAQKAVVDPSAAQLVGEGFFTLRGAPGAGPEAFSPAFVRSMIKHGFGHGAEWGTPDLMHFELRWKGPASP